MILILQAMITKLTKPFALMMVAFFFQGTSENSSIIDRAFEYGLSIGILAIVVTMLYKEWKMSQSYNKERDEKLEQLIAGNTQAYDKMENAINNLADEQKQFRDELKFIHRRVDTNRQLIEDKNNNQ